MGKPPEIAEIDLTAPPKVAGGLGAITSTTAFLQRETGLVRGARTLLKINQPDGFDCPGCAWPEPAPGKRHHLEFCENGAKAIAEEATTKRATPDVFALASVDDMRMLSDFELGQLGRITHPMILDPATRTYVPIAWDQAIATIAAELRALGPSRSAFYTSGRTSNEAAFLYQLMGRLFGTNNFPDCSNMCHESSGVGLRETIGVGKGTVSLDDFAEADLIVVIGQNPGTNHPRMLSTLREAAQRGATIVSVNPLREPGLGRFAHPQKPLDFVRGGVALARDHIAVRIGGDLAFFVGVSKALLEREAAGEHVLDDAFLDEHTVGFEAWAASVRSIPWARLVAGSGVDEATIRRFAETYARAERVIACWAMGLTQHKHAVATIQEVVNVMLLRGNLGRPGAGLCPVRGHSNVQGDRTVGIDHNLPAWGGKLGEVVGFAPPREGGLDIVDTVRAMRDGEVRGLVALGGNVVSAMSDTAVVAAALDGCRLTVSISTKVNRTHLHPGEVALILPCLGRTEIDLQAGRSQFVTVEDSMSCVHRSQGHLEPASDELRSEPWIVASLAAALVPDAPVDWAALAADYDRIRDLIAQVVPGFADYNARAREPAGFVLPSTARGRDFTPVGGRARFTISAPPDLTLPPGRLRMMTVRSHDQYNTTIYGLDDRYRGVRHERRVILMNPDDIRDLGLEERQVVDLVSEWHGEERRAERFIVVPHELPRGDCATYFPEANVLVPLDAVAEKSNTPASKSTVVRVEATLARP